VPAPRGGRPAARAAAPRRAAPALRLRPAARGGRRPDGFGLPPLPGSPAGARGGGPRPVPPAGRGAPPAPARPRPVPGRRRPGAAVGRPARAAGHRGCRARRADRPGGETRRGRPPERTARCRDPGAGPAPRPRRGLGREDLPGAARRRPGVGAGGKGFGCERQLLVDATSERPLNYQGTTAAAAETLERLPLVGEPAQRHPESLAPAAAAARSPPGPRPPCPPTALAPTGPGRSRPSGPPARATTALVSSPAGRCGRRPASLTPAEGGESGHSANSSPRFSLDSLPALGHTSAISPAGPASRLEGGPSEGVTLRRRRSGSRRTA
jgi:hypothetical protein